VKALTVLDAHSICIKRTWERRINERVWKRVNREKHEKDKMTEDSNTHGSEESQELRKDVSF
jgi:hypothetical protein